MHEAKPVCTGSRGEEGAERKGVWLPSHLSVRAELELEKLVTELSFVTDIEPQIEVGAVLSGCHDNNDPLCSCAAIGLPRPALV